MSVLHEQAAALRAKQSRFKRLRASIDREAVIFIGVIAACLGAGYLGGWLAMEVAGACS